MGEGISNKESKTNIWGGKWVAVVDDSTAVSEAFQSLLGHRVNVDSVKYHGFTSAESFIERAADYDLVILDARLSSNPKKLTGPQAIDRIRGVNPETIIVGYSGEEEYQRRFREAGADLVIPKDMSGQVVKIIQLCEERWSSNQGL